MSGSQLEQLRQLAKEVVHGHNLVLYDVELGQQRSRAVVRVYVDRASKVDRTNGVTVGECQSISRELGHILEVEEPLPFAYVLEVSSPGLERPLHEPRHYTLAVGERVRLVLSDESGDLEGILEAVEEDGVQLRLAPPLKKVKKGQIAKIPPLDQWEVRVIAFDAISRARTVYMAP